MGLYGGSSRHSTVVKSEKAEVDTEMAAVASDQILRTPDETMNKYIKALDEDGLDTSLCLDQMEWSIAASRLPGQS